MLPFDNYPGVGRELLGRVRGANCRYEYGLEFMQITGQTCCAYCGLDMAASYENWLQLALDHVVPSSVGKSYQLPDEWVDDFANRVIACTHCNGFGNRYKPSLETATPKTLEEFFVLRDYIFAERKPRIAQRHVQEREFFERRLWQNPPKKARRSSTAAQEK